MRRHFTRLEAIHAVEFRACKGIELTFVVDHFDRFEAVALADLEVILIVRRRDFEATGAELAVDIFVANDRDFCLRERPPDRLADQVLVTLILRMHRDRSIAHEGFGACGGNFEMRAFAVWLHQLVAHFIEEATLRLHVHLFVGNRGVRGRAPVDHALATIDVTTLIERHECGEHGLRVVLIQSEAGAIPVAGRAKLLQLV